MSKHINNGLLIAVIILLVAVLAVLTVNLVKGGIWIVEGLNGQDGQAGEDGADGLSAYELACREGFSGSLHDWLVSLAIPGKDGTDGASGADGKDGADGADGIGVRDVRINAAGHLLVTLTNGLVLDAGAVTSAEGPTLGDTVDADGYRETYEIVIQTGYDHLNLRRTPDITNGEIYTSVKRDAELLRIGVNEETGYSRFLHNGTVCYARSSNFELKYLYSGEIPEVRLPDTLALTRGEILTLYTERIVPLLPDYIKPTFSYTGAAERTYDGDRAFSVIPTEIGEATLTFSLSTEDEGEWRVIYRHEVAVTVVEANPSLSLCGLVIGDSRVAGGALTDALQAKLPNVSLLGTCVSPNSVARHEGRSGWTTDYLLTQASVGGVINPFYSTATQGFDFAHYMETYYPNETLDFVVLQLGFEDAYSESAIRNINTMVSSILAYAEGKGSTVRVMVLSEYLTNPSDCYLSGVYKNWDLYALRQKQIRSYTHQFSLFAGREGDGIDLLPVHAIIGEIADFPSAIPAGKTEARVTDPVNLSEIGTARVAELILSRLYKMDGVG